VAAVLQEIEFQVPPQPTGIVILVRHIAAILQTDTDHRKKSPAIRDILAHFFFGCTLSGGIETNKQEAQYQVAPQMLSCKILRMAPLFK
jgi:hypothetical protein